MRFRNTHKAFNLDGDINVDLDGESIITITRKYEENYATLKANLKTYDFKIIHS